MQRLKLSALILGVALVASTIAVGPGHAELIGVQQASAGQTSKVYKVNTTTGANTLLGDSGIQQLISLALTPDGTYYAAGGGTGNQQLVTINPVTGAGTLVAPISTIDSGLSLFNGLAAGTDGTLYGVMTPTGGASTNLYTINRTNGVATLIGATGVTGLSALDVNDATNTLYGINGTGTQSARGLYTINMVTGASTFIGPTPNGSPLNTQGLVFLPDGTLWGSDATSLFTIDPATGVATTKFTLAGNGTPSFRGIEYLAPVPVPAALWLFGSGLAAMVGVARRRAA